MCVFVCVYHFRIHTRLGIAAALKYSSRNAGECHDWAIIRDNAATFVCLVVKLWPTEAHPLTRLGTPAWSFCPLCAVASITKQWRPINRWGSDLCGSTFEEVCFGYHLRWPMCSCFLVCFLFFPGGPFICGEQWKDCARGSGQAWWMLPYGWAPVATIPVATPRQDGTPSPGWLSRNCRSEPGHVSSVRDQTSWALGDVMELSHC